MSEFNGSPGAFSSAYIDPSQRDTIPRPDSVDRAVHACLEPVHVALRALHVLHERAESRELLLAATPFRRAAVDLVGVRGTA